MNISCVIPSHNSGVLLEKAIHSVRSQTGPFVLDEIIIVDDHSSDPQTLETYEKVRIMPGVRLIHGIQGTGPGSARNYGVCRVESPWICFLDADDVMAPASISERIAALDMLSTREAVFVGGDFLIWYGDDHFDTAPFFASRPRTRECLRQAFEKHDPIRLRKPALQFIDSVLCTSASILMEKNLFTEVGGFDERLRFCEDHHFFIRLASKADFIFTPSVIYWYRQHSANMTRDVQHPSLVYAEALSLLLMASDMSHFREVIAKRLTELEYDVAQWHRENGRFGDAWRAAARLIRFSPKSWLGWKQLLACALRIR